MSNSTNNNPPFWPTWRSSRDYGASYSPNANNDSNRIEPVFRPSMSFQPTADNRRNTVRDPRQTPEERVVTRPSSFSGFPEHQRAAPAPVQIVWLDNMPPRSVNPRFSGPIPWSTAQQQHIPQSNSRSNLDDEQTNVITKLKKEIYNPLPKQMTRRLSSFYRDHQNNNRSRSSNIYNFDKGDEDGKRCAICLEDFEAGEQVMVTPCDHMFHEECIVPWVKSHGQCPVCRFVLSERIKQSAAAAASNSINNISNVVPPIATDLFAVGELMSIIRALEEAFLWGSR